MLVANKLYHYQIETQNLKKFVEEQKCREILEDPLKKEFFHLQNDLTKFERTNSYKVLFMLKISLFEKMIKSFDFAGHKLANVKAREKEKGLFKGKLERMDRKITQLCEKLFELSQNIDNDTIYFLKNIW